MKELIIYPVGTLHKIRWGGGGEVPAILSGSYTSKGAAEFAINSYLSTRKRDKKSA